MKSRICRILVLLSLSICISFVFKTTFAERVARHGTRRLPCNMAWKGRHTSKIAFTFVCLLSVGPNRHKAHTEEDRLRPGSSFPCLLPALPANNQVWRSRILFRPQTGLLLRRRMRHSCCSGSRSLINILPGTPGTLFMLIPAQAGAAARPRPSFTRCTVRSCTLFFGLP